MIQVIESNGREYLLMVFAMHFHPSFLHLNYFREYRLCQNHLAYCGSWVKIALVKLHLVALLASVAIIGDAVAGSPVPLREIPFKTMEGQNAALRDYAGKVILVVNVASLCGNTPQYTALEKLYTDNASKGFVVVAFPCNDFKNQEPGTDAEIKQFCSSKYHVTFPIFDKIHVKGPEQHPLYAALTGPDAKFPGDVKWNFGKFLIGKNGEVLARFEPKVQPDDPKVLAAVADALK